MKIAAGFMFGLLMAAGNALAGPEDVDPGCPTHDKSGFNLFHRTPDSLLRELDADRPDRGSSPHTLDAGRFQIESGLLSYTHDGRTLDGTRTQSWTVGETMLRAGLNDWAEIQLVIPFYESARTTDGVTHKTEHASGIGDLTVAFKASLWGNDGGDTAGGVELFVKTPTASHGLGNGRVEGGALFLFSAKLPGDFEFGFNTGAGIAANDDGGGHHAEIINVISFSHDIAGPFTAFLEFFSSVPTRQSHDWVGTVDVGLLYKIGKNLQLDAGINIGVTRAAEDLQPFLGVTYRF